MLASLPSPSPVPTHKGSNTAKVAVGIHIVQLVHLVSTQSLLDRKMSGVDLFSTGRTKATVGGVPPFSLVCLSLSHEWLCTPLMKVV